MSGAIEYKEGEWRLTAAGKMYRRGIMRYANGDVYDGEWVEGRRCGRGKYMYSNGDMFIGEFDNNQWDGFGIHTRIDFLDATTMNVMVDYRYEGRYKHGKKNGLGLLFVGNGDIYEGEFAHDKYQGHGKMNYSNGDVYEGQWMYSKYDGKGELATHTGDKYTGDFHGGMFHGHGEFQWDNGKGGHYSGAYVKGLKSGPGVRVYSNGTKYNGDFLEDEMNGEGVLQNRNGDTYVGNFKNNKKCGSGVKSFAHGDRYEGEFMDNTFYGRGKFHYADGSYYDGEYMATYIHKGTGKVYPLPNGKKHGYGVRVWSNGSRYEGKWLDDKPEGHGFYSNPERSERFEGSFWHGNRQGFGVQIDSHGTYEGQWQDGRMHGEGTFTWIDGKTYTGQWARGKKHGFGKVTLVPVDEIGLGADRCFIGGFDYMYRGSHYEGMFEEDDRTGTGTLTYTNGHEVKGIFLKGTLKEVISDAKLDLIANMLPSKSMFE